MGLAPHMFVFAMQVIFARYLTVTEIGQFAIVNLLLILFMTSTNWGVDRYIIANKKINENEINEVFTQELIFSFLAYVFCITLFREHINNYISLEDSNFFWASILCIFLYNPLSRSKALLEKKMSFLSAYLPALTSHFLGSSLGLLLLISGYGIWSMIAWKITVFIGEYLILLMINKERLKLSFNFKNLNTHLVFCMPLFFGGILSFFSVTADIWIVNNLLGSYELGLYWLAFSMSHVVLVIRTLINRILLPLLSNEVSAEKKIELFTTLNGFLQIITAATVILVTYWGADLFLLIFGSKWLEATPLFIILFYAVAFKIISGTANSLLHSFMKTSIDLKVALVNTIILIPLVAVFTYFGGVIGTSIAVLVSTILMTIYVYEAHVRKVCSLGFKYFFSYLSINIITLAFINIIFLEYFDNLFIRSFATIVSILIAYLTLSMPSIKNRKLDLAKVFVR